MITQQDREDYGDDLIAFSRRAALEALGPEVRHLQQQSHALQARLRQETRRGLEQQLDRCRAGGNSMMTRAGANGWTRPMTTAASPAGS
jgi:hypothetical protein